MLRKADVATKYDIDANGRIESPGKFEGEPWWAIALWNAAMEGCANETTEDEGTPIDWFDILTEHTTGEMSDMPAELAGKRVGIYEDESGFVRVLAPESV